MDTVLFLTPAIHEACPDVLRGIQCYARVRGWRVQIAEEARQSVSYGGLVKFCKPIGCIAVCGSRLPESLDEMAARMPLVTVDRDPGSKDGRDCPNVYQENAVLGRLAAKELLALGLRHYAYAGNPFLRVWDDERREAFVSELAAKGKRVHVFPCALKGRGLSGYPAAILKWLRTIPRPVGIFCTNDWAAERVIGVCGLLGYRIPDEVAVLGVDNDEQICSNTRPTLSSVHPDFIRAGYLAAEQLDRILSNPRLKPRTAYYHAAMVVHRESTARAAAGADEGLGRALVEIARLSGVGLRVADVVRMTGCSRRVAELRFRKVLGTTISGHLRNLRVERAAGMFLHGANDLRDVAESCGFGTVANLRNAFKGVFGKSIRKWLKDHFM